MSEKTQLYIGLIVVVIYVAFATGLFFIGKKQGRLKGGSI